MAKHISSEAISDIIDSLQKNAKDGPNGVSEIKKHMSKTEIGFPAFSLLGTPLNMAYGSARQAVGQTLDEIGRSVDDYIAELGKAKAAWVEAENANTVVVTD